MSANACPTCREAKEKSWHLVCPACWAKVPPATQQEIYRLYKTERGSANHRVACMKVVQDLCRQRSAQLKFGVRRVRA